MPSTTPYGFEFESLTDGEPTRTLNGGSAGTDPILAEQVNDEIQRVDSDLQELQEAVSRGWEDITPAGGQVITDETVIDIPPETYDMIRVTIRGSLDGEGYVSLRINNDSTPELHRRAWTVWQINDGSVATSGADDTTVWRMARWSTAPNNIAWCTIYNTDVSSFLTMEGQGFRAAAGLATRERTEFYGALSATRLLSSLRFGGFLANVDSVRVWIEGHRA